ncbi:MAG TPA: insulinase family protein, partial [Planctomycetaceae bacterium]|nr:insulinase family protein [Planctomycetaceae bacterium]
RELRAIEDDLAQKVMQTLRRQQYPSPYGRNVQGQKNSLERITSDHIRDHYQALYRPNQAILGVAGKIEWEPLKEHVGNLLADWEPADLPAVDEGDCESSYIHLPEQSVQTHIGISSPSVPYSDPDYFQARGAVGVLSDGMSSRLFTEVREKRGLCYTVYASCHTLRDRGSIMAYAGTTTERAQETLDVMTAELIRLSEGIYPQELQRLKARVKSALIMHQESSTARSAAIAADWYYLNHVRSIEELASIIDQLTCESINAYLEAHQPRDFKVATLGEQALEVPIAIP